MPGSNPTHVDYLEGLMEGFVAYDADWVMTYMNASAERMLGRDRSDVLGKTWHEAFPHAVGNAVDHMYQRVKSTRRPERMEYFYAHYKQWMEISASPLSNGGVGVYFREITDRKNAEGELRDAARRKDEFLATLAHELRNPLAPIVNALEVMNMQGAQDAATNAARALMGRQLKLLVRLIDDLLDANRITTGKLELRRGRVELAAVMEQALETSRPLLRGHDFTVSLPPEPVWLYADPVRIAQVLSNLINNACKYTPAGGAISVGARAEKGGEGRSVRISIKDTGIGIPPEHMPRLFEMFSQAAAARDHAIGGLGIGLALSRALVEMHGGTLEGASEGPGRGAEFTVTLPAMESGGTTQERKKVQPAAGASKRVLVVDDNRDSATSLAMMLRAVGHTVEIALDGERAVERAATFRPDTVLLDIGLPGMNGLEACRRIRNQAGGDTILIAAITGWGQDHDALRAKEAGFDAHFVKPVDLAQIAALLTAARA